MYNTDENAQQYSDSAMRCASHNRESCNFDGSESEQINNIRGKTCGCGENSGSKWGLIGYPLANMYAPLQNLDNLYDCETALKKGTLFRELDLPFVCGKISGGTVCE